MEYAAVVVGSYLIGSIPFALVIGRLLGKVDVRDYGSGNLGTTNVMRTAGKKAGVIVLICDVLKGVTAIFIARYTLDSHIWEAIAGLAAVAGHDWSIFLKFQGGKGVATAVGVLFVMAPLAAVGGIVIFALVSFLSKYVSLGSLIGSSSCIAIVGAMVAADRIPVEYLIYTAAVVALIFITHRDNIARLLSGTENKLGQKVERRQTG